jgi:hypothetical protein
VNIGIALPFLFEHSFFKHSFVKNSTRKFIKFFQRLPC